MKQAWKKYLLYGSLIIVVVALILAGYSATWTGFGDHALPNGDFVRSKTLWDWMELLIIPLVLAIGAFFLQRSERAVERKAADDRAKLERELATDRQQEAALQAYLDRMSELLLKEKSGKSEDERVLKVKRVRTLTVMRGLNAARNDIVLRFLHDIGLAGKMESNLFVNAKLERADLKGAFLSETNLEDGSLPEADMQGAYLKGANLQGAVLEGANLQGAFLDDANLQGAVLESANLQGAYLKDANLEGAVLESANLEGAILEGANLKSANLEYANLKSANLKSANLEGANLQHAFLAESDLQNAILRDANLEESILIFAKLQGAELSNDQLATAFTFKGATMQDGTKHD